MKNMEANRPANRLVAFVEKLDALTVDPPKIQITGEARAKLLTHLKELDEPDFLTDPFAQDQLIAMQKLLQDQSKVFEDAGFKWSDFSPIGNTKPPQNSFKTGDASKHLKAIQDRLSKAG